MNDQPRQALCKLIRDKGNNIYSDTLFGALISDYFGGDFKKERYVILESIREDIPNSLLSKSAAIPYDILSSQLIHKLIHCGYTEDLATWAIDSWAIAFAIIPLDYWRNSPSGAKPPATLNDAVIPTVFKIKETDILAFTPIQFKLYMKEMFEQIGYVVTLAPPSNNFVDFVISGKKGDIVVVTKKYSKSVSATVIERILAAKKFYDANKAVVITTSSFSDSAFNSAKANEVELWNYDTIIKILKVEGIETILSKAIIDYFTKYSNPDTLNAQQITTFSVRIIEGAISGVIHKSRNDDNLITLAILYNFQQERRINLILSTLKKFNHVSSYDVVKKIYQDVLERNNYFSKNPGHIEILDYSRKEQYENMVLTISYDGICPICENPINITPIDRVIYDPKKIYHAIISCSHCSFHAPDENIISDSLKEKILKEAETHKNDLSDIDLFE